MKISGIYKAHDGFLYTVFYDRKKKKYIMYITNSKGKFCSSTAYTKSEILIQIRDFIKNE